MTKILSALLIFLIISNRTLSQIFPEEGSALHYRLIGFSFPAGKKATSYDVEIATGNFNSKDSFQKNIVVTANSKVTKIIMEVPAFGKQYTWRTIRHSGKNSSRSTVSKLHHFSTGMSPNVDTAKIHLRIMSPAQKYQDAYIFTDGNKALYDMKGRPIWYLPNVDGQINENAQIRDLKVTPQGTITFLLDEKRAYEINYNGDVLWKGPNNNIDNPFYHYHHQFTRLGNGHYMLMATRPGVLRHHLDSDVDSGFVIVTDSNDIHDSLHSLYETFPFVSLVEYDENGNVVWVWKTLTYLATSDVYYRVPQPHRKKYDVHPNSFYFDEQNKVVYLGFRDINRILKIQYPSGKVLEEYGEKYTPAKSELDSGLFAGQHTIIKAADGELCIYNNGTNEGRPTTSTIQKLREQGDTVAKTWEYRCFIENYEKLKHKVTGNTIGGNVMELPDHSLFVSMSNEYSQVFIVDTNKNILFSAMPETWERREKVWRMVDEYHASIVKDRAEMERMILNTAGGK